MRNLSILAGWLILGLASGCAAPGFNWFKPATAKGPVQPVPSKEALVAYLNENAVSDKFGKKVQSLDCKGIDVKITANPDNLVKSQTINLKANMVAQGPRNFFMRGDLGGSTWFDIGSNDQEFWWWVKDIKGGPTNQYYCAYRDLQEGRAGKLNFPLRPEWIVEVLGLGPYGPPEKYQLSSDAETVRLIEKTIVQGRAVSKIIVFQRRKRVLPEPIVSDFLLVDDATGKEICSADIAEAQMDNTNTNAVLPRKIELMCSGPDMKVRMVLTLNQVAVNPGLPNPRVLAANGQPRVNPGDPVPMSAFERRPMNGIPSVNLAGMMPTGGVRQVQGQER